MILNILLSIWWVDSLGYGGLALANSVATSLEMIVLLYLLNRRMDGIEARRLFASASRSLIAALIMGLAVYLWLEWLGGANVGATAARWLAPLVGMALAAGVYGLASLALKNEEMQSLTALVRRRISG